MPAVSVLVPYGFVGGARERAWKWLERGWRSRFPDFEVLVGEADAAPDPGDFNRPQAINRAARYATGSTFVIADSDTAFEPIRLIYALGFAANTMQGAGRWILPDRYVRLGPNVSACWTAQEPLSAPPPGWEGEILEEWPSNVSGLVIVPAAVFHDVGGLDERFTGWGADDDAFACALSTFAGPPIRFPGLTAFHLWHPRPPEHTTAQPNYPAQRALAARYLTASGDPDAMRALIAESRTRVRGTGS